ncbi:MAG: hypothetical protein E6G64_17875 [Actinobacteria bacterium]|nr:MAG: hypothetical protein E6G64_17875 [Actinomycetota bacterium]
MSDGRVEGIFLTETHGEVPQSVSFARAVAGGGLVGNRYFYEDGDAPPGRAVTLIAAEGLEAFEQETGILLTAGETRRNVLTRGIDVNALVESMTKPGILKGLVHRAGLNADVVTGGDIAVGDAVAAL